MAFFKKLTAEFENMMGDDRKKDEKKEEKPAEGQRGKSFSFEPSVLCHNKTEYNFYGL